MEPVQHLAALTTKKAASLFALSGTFVFATEIADPQIKEWATYGVGGVLALVIFYFYRQQAAASLLREQQNGERHAQMTETVLEVVQENSKVITGLHETVTVLHQTIANMNIEQQRRYEDSLRAGGRRTYDPEKLA